MLEVQLQERDLLPLAELCGRLPGQAVHAKRAPLAPWHHVPGHRHENRGGRPSLTEGLAAPATQLTSLIQQRASENVGARSGN